MSHWSAPSRWLIAWCLLLPSLVFAQRVRWEPAAGSLALGQVSQLSLIFEDCEPAEQFTLPQIPNLTVGQATRGEQSSFNIINGQATRSKTVYYTYPVRPNDRASIRIPAFTIETDKGPLRVESVTFEVGEATIGNSSIPLDSAVNSRITVGAGPIWAGEVVPVTYVLSVTNRFSASYAPAPDWDPSPLVIEEWTKPEPGTALVNGDARATVTYRSRGYIREPGSYTLGSANQLVNIRLPSSGFSIFQSFQAEQYNITSNTPEVTVRPLPSPAAQGFNGAVGQFKLTSQVIPAKAAVGEPITWTLELTGVGNWPDIPGLPPRNVSRDFRVVQPQARRTPVAGKLFESTLTEDVVLIPTRAGQYRLGPVVWSFFNPETGRYETITTEQTTVEVTAPAAAPTTSTTSGEVTPSGGTSEAPLVRATPAPVAPEAIPRDPVPPAGMAARPWSLAQLRAYGVAVALLVPLAWLGLALRRAWQTDPGRRAREARQRLRKTLAELAQTTDVPARQRLLQAWQRDAARLWQLRRAAPTANGFAADATWRQLWEESERALFSARAELPGDWISRAQGAWTRRPGPRFRARTIFRPQNLLPLLVAAVMLVSENLSAAEPAADAYAKGEFRQAEQLWRERIQAAPTDWSARHNLALALAQQERWSEAGAHALVALVQHPTRPEVRWHAGYTLARAGYVPPGLDFFANPSTGSRVAWQLSPAGWQRVILAAIGLLALAAILTLLRAYRVMPRIPLAVGIALAACAVVLGVTAAVGLGRFGLTRDARAVLVWRSTPLRSLPTDLATDQQTSTLAPGTIALVQKEFLGWRQLGFPNGQTGWVRKEEFVPFWGAP